MAGQGSPAEALTRRLRHDVVGALEPFTVYLGERLTAADLIDEYRLLVQPLVLGTGRALFDQLPGSRHLNLVEALPFPSGVVVHIYRPQHT